MLPDHLILRTVRALPRKRDRKIAILENIKARREHKRKWPEPEATLILDLHFEVYSFNRHSYHAEATMEIPLPRKTEYASISLGAKTREDSLILLIQKIENSFWFQYMRSRGVRFRVTGASMETLYRGYL